MRDRQHGMVKGSAYRQQACQTSLGQGSVRESHPVCQRRFQWNRLLSAERCKLTNLSEEQKSLLAFPTDKRAGLAAH